MKVIIAEKPSVAREIAQIVGAKEKEDGYLAGNGYCVTWAFGHLIALGMPEDYGLSGFSKDILPILPNPYILTVRKVKKDKGYVADSGALKQLKIIQKLFDRCDRIIVATDAGREGELIFRYIYEYLKCTKPFERLWISSLTEKAINLGFDKLKPGSDFDGLYGAARCRSQADWLIGINSTQALSIATGDGIYSLGRVQTPTLALICKRYLENKAFTVEKYWKVELLHTKDHIEFKSISQTKLADKKQAEQILRSIERNSQMANVISVDIKNATEQPPLLFDLTALQKEANRKLNLSAEETLNIAQSLYEKKFITYPRTGSKHITEDLWEEIPSLLRALQNEHQFKQATGHIKWGNLNKRIVNDLKVTDHHGLLITDKIPSALSTKEKAIYDMIAFRLLESVSSAYLKEMTNISLQIMHYDFASRGTKILEGGWRLIKGEFFDGTEDSQEMPTIKEGDEIKVKNSSILEKHTQPPILYTEAGILSAMETAGKEIKNDDERKALKDIGIGTPATRASIIETLVDRTYIIRQKKSLIPTEKGLQVHELVKDKKISDVAMTAEWEVALQKIENRELDAKTFQTEIETFAGSITQELLQIPFKQKDQRIFICPKCKSSQLIIRESIVKCPDEVCNWSQFGNVCGIHLGLSEIENLVTNHKTSLIKGMKSKTGKKFDAYITLDDQSRLSFEFLKNK